MAGTFLFELVSPDQLLYSEQVESVVVPGTEGEFTMLVNHAPLVTALKNGGVILVNGDGNSKEFAVFGGIAEATNDTLTVLAERTTPIQEVTVETIDQDMLTAQTYLDGAHSEDEKVILRAKIAQLEEFRNVIVKRGAGGATAH